MAEAYLRTDVASQELFLYRTLPGRGGSLRVDGAQVTIRDEAGRTLTLPPARGGEACARYDVFEEQSAGSCYASASNVRFVEPGRAYSLDVTLPDGGRLTGATTVPAAFEIRRPAAPTCVLDSGRYQITWTRSEGAWAYQTVAWFRGLAPGLEALGVEAPPDELELLGLALGTSDTTIVFPEEFGVFDRFSLDRDLLLALQNGIPEGAYAELTVAAGDRNFVNWVRGGNFNPSGQIRVPSIIGDGTGVFAALMVLRRTLVAEGTPGELPSCE